MKKKTSHEKTNGFVVCTKNNRQPNIIYSNNKQELTYQRMTCDSHTHNIGLNINDIFIAKLHP